MSNANATILVALDVGLLPDQIELMLPAGDPTMEVIGIVEGLENSWRTLQESDPDVLVVACKGYSERALYLIDGAAKERPDRPIIVLCEASPSGFLRRVFEAGADDVVVLPAEQEGIRFALQKSLARRQGAALAGDGVLGKLICVLGPKGGAGKTFTACNLAVGLAESGKSVAVVDLDLQFGDVGLALGLPAERTSYDLAKAGGTIDFEKVEGYLATHSSGAKVLLAPMRPDQASFVTVELLREVYATLRSHFDYVIVDTPPAFPPEVIATIDSSTNVCMVGVLDSLSLKNTKVGLETLDLMGYDRERITLVLNRADSRVGITKDDVTAILGSAPTILIPSDRDIPRSVNEATPITSSKTRSEAARAFRKLAASYVGSEAAPLNGHGHANGNGNGNGNGGGKRRRLHLLGRRS